MFTMNKYSAARTCIEQRAATNPISNECKVSSQMRSVEMTKHGKNDERHEKSHPSCDGWLRSNFP
jgi:hypothetical protein